MESIFILVPPRGCSSPSILQKIRECLTEVGAQIEAEAFLSTDALQLCPSRLAVLFGSAHYWSMAPSEEVLQHPYSSTEGDSDVPYCPAEEDLKSIFYSHYGELWDAAVLENRLQTAYDVLKKGKMTAAELEQRCVCAAAAAAHNVLELPTCLTITKLGGDDRLKSEEPLAHYVVNGAYPAQRERFLQSNADQNDCWWCAATLPDFSSTQEGWQADKLSQLSRAIEGFFPSCTDVRVVTNPLEALAYRVMWMQVPLTRDKFASQVLQQDGVQPCWLAALLRDPVMHDRGHFFSVFEMVQGKTSKEAADTLAQLWTELQHDGKGKARRDAVDGFPALYDYENGSLDPSLYTAVADVNRAYAVALVHPRLIARGELLGSLQRQLGQREIGVDAVHPVFAVELKAKLDLHFGSVARYALDQAALQRLGVDAPDVTSSFEEVHGVSWQLAMDEGRIWSVTLAEQLLGRRHAQALLKDSLSQDCLTHQLSPFLAITKISRHLLTAQTFPDTSLRALFSTGHDSQRPYALTPDTFFIANAAYGVYRNDLLQQIKSGEVAGEVWQLSWASSSDIQLKEWLRRTLSPPTSKPSPHVEDLDAIVEEPISTSYDASVGVKVRQAFPLLNVLDDPALALRARHLWWGTPYDEDALSRQLRARGQSWVSFLSPLAPDGSASTLSLSSASSTALMEAVLMLPPRVATNHTISLTHTVLQENKVNVIEETDLYGEEAAAYAFGGNCLLAAASSLAHRRGAALWEQFPPALQSAITDVADGIRAASDEFVPTISAENLIGGATACVALQITMKTLEEAWHAAKPRRVDRTCWLAFFSEYEVWVVNGHIASLEHRYSQETARVHLMRICWPATSKSWADMQAALIGTEEVGLICSNEDRKNKAASSAASTGSLTMLLSRVVEKEAKNEADTAALSMADAEPLCLLSSTPYDAVIDTLRWPHRGWSSPLKSEVALEDWLLRQPYIREQLTGSVACSLTSVVQQVRESLANVSETQRPLSSLASTPQWITRFAQSQCDAQLHHGFMWLHPSTVTPSVLEAVPLLLLQHGVHIRDSGVLPLHVTVERQLLDVHHSSFYKNAYVRTAAQVPITDAEMHAFSTRFGQNWITAVQLGLVLNAQEAEQKYGTVRLTTWWDSLPNEHQAWLSDQLLIGYIAEEGLYVMNPPYSYRRARLYTGGSEVVWYAVEWPRQNMTWDDFMNIVVGDANPATATPDSLRGHFYTEWTRYSLPGQPDQIECVLHASESPLAALADRCRWLDCSPEHDPYGLVLLQLGVHPTLLSQLLSNFALYADDTGIMTEAFRLLRQEDVYELVAQLRNYACCYGFLAIPDFVTLIPPPLVLEAEKQRDEATPQEEEYPSLVKQLRAYRDVVLQKSISLFQLCSFSRPFSDQEVPPRTNTATNEYSLCDAILYLDPLEEQPGSEDATSSRLCSATQHALCHFVEQHLRRRGIRVVHERLVQCAGEAEATVLHRTQHHRLYRYGIETPATETLSSSITYQANMKQHFGISLQSTVMVLRNAAEMASALRVSGHEVAALWTRAKRLYPRDTLVLSDDCVVQRLHPRKPLFLLNGDAMEAEQVFATRQAKAGVRVWYLQWDAQKQPGISYAQLAQAIASLQGARGPWRACWSTYGWATEATATSIGTGAAAAPDFCPLLHISESSLAAMRQRQLWFGLPVSTDPIVREWLTAVSDNGEEKPPVHVPLPPRAVSWALRDPSVSLAGKSEPEFLFDTVMGMDAARMLECLYKVWITTQSDECCTRRSTAVITLMPQAAANPSVCNLVRGVIAENDLRIEESGFVAHYGDGDGGAKVRHILQYLCPEDWGYATQEPHLLSLSPQECDCVASVFKTSWTSMVDSGRVLPASRATKRLGGMSPAQLQLFVKAAKNAVWVRPHLHLAELEEYGVFVVNAHVAHLSNIIATAAEKLPLPFYIVSWDACQCSWEECVSRVVGAAEPSLTSPQSIRGRVNAAWASLGLHAAPTMGESVVYMSEGPLHSLLARLRLRWPAMEALDEDLFGGLLLESLGGAATVVPVLQGWLSNSVITCDGHTDGVLGHLAHWETEEILNLLKRVAQSSSTLLPSNLSAVRAEERGAEGRRAAEAAWKAAVRQRNTLPLLLNTTTKDGEVLPTTATTTEEDTLLHRNVGTLLFLSSQLDETRRAHLRQHLQQYGVSISITAQEEEQEATPDLLDRLFPTESALAECADLAQVLKETDEVTPEDRERFHIVFRDEVHWQTLLEQTQPAHEATPDMLHGLYSAADAMQLWKWTPHDLWTKLRGGLSMRLTEGIVVTRLPFGCASVRKGGAKLDQDEIEDAELAFPAEAPWGGHYVINGAYAALRDALQRKTSSAATTRKESGSANGEVPSTPLLTMWEISWDSRTLAWRDVVERVIGCADSEHAAADSFNALMWKEICAAEAEEAKQEATACASPLSCLGVVTASGPLAAFAMRSRWTRNAGNRYNVYVPDPLLRAMAVAGVVDQTSFLANAVSDPVVVVKKSNDTGMDVRCRLFDWTRLCDTLQVMQWLRALDAAAANATPDTTEDHAVNITVAAAPETPKTDSELEERSPPPPPPRMKKQLDMARVKDAMLHARTESEWRRLWDYYGNFDVSAAESELSVTAAKRDTIPFAPFYQDFRVLDSLGVPGMSHELKNLFLDVEVKGRGRMTYAQFTRALSLYQSL